MTGARRDLEGMSPVEHVREHGVGDRVQRAADWHLELVDAGLVADDPTLAQLDPVGQPGATTSGDPRHR